MNYSVGKMENEKNSINDISRNETVMKCLLRQKELLARFRRMKTKFLIFKI